MRNRLICLVCLALLSTFSYAQQKAPPSGRGMEQPAIPSICDAIEANLLRTLNCGFEEGDFSLWNLTGPTDYTGVGSGPEVNSGTYGAFFGPIGDYNRLSRIVPFVRGFYHIEFWLANTLGGTNAHFEASYGSQELMVLDDPDPFEFTLFTFDGLALPGSCPMEEVNNLCFVFRHDPWFWYFDDVDFELIPAGTARK